jgi:hypothetical protein
MMRMDLLLPDLLFQVSVGRPSSPTGANLANTRLGGGPWKASVDSRGVQYLDSLFLVISAAVFCTSALPWITISMIPAGLVSFYIQRLYRATWGSG